MNSSRRGRIVALVNKGIPDEQILEIIDSEFQEDTYATSNRQALYGTKRGIGVMDAIPAKNRILQEPRRSGARLGERGESDLVAQLRCFNAMPVIKRYQDQFLNGKTAGDIFSVSFGSNIYRAFRHESPTKRYRAWRWVSKPQELVRNLNHLDSQENYDRLLLEIAHSLVDEWGPRNDLGAPTRMNIGIALKITNLIMKHLSFSRNTSNPQLIQWLHVLWDKFTLKPLRNIWHFTPAMPAEPSQGFVSTLGIYNNLHGIINEISNNAGCPRIYFELFFWNRSHSL